ncbi:hypothetical protein [Agromyces silvae]|uniref:hypothetical protein n=1 Tax=Agromyces silvae TaxID=3388266 RepID=UPI00280AE8A4|nr:hypothetical protein [Agromyces protaetiae]
MRSRGGVLAAASGVVLILAGVAGCTDPPASRSTTLPSATERSKVSQFALSNKEALDAAVVAFERYVELANQIGAAGGAEPERLYEALTPELAEESIANFQRMQRDGLRLEGSSTVRGVRLVQQNADLVQVYACLQAGSTRLIDRTGADVTTADRQIETPLVVNLQPGDSGTLLISQSEQWPWPDNDIC